MTTNTNATTPTQGTVLERSCMLVKLKRHKFNHNVTDKKLGKKYRKELKVKRGTNAVRVQKTIIPREAVQPWNKILNEAGKYFYSVTIPWDDKSWRLLPVVKYKEFVNNFRDFQARFTEAVDDFVNNIDRHIKDGKEMLGLAYDESDYMDKKAVRGEFLLKVEYEQLKAASDFRAQVTEEERQEIAEIITQQNEERFAQAQASVFQRVFTVAQKLSEKMAEKPGKGKTTPEFRDSIIGNIQDLVDILPSLNVVNDPNLKLLKDQLESQLSSIDPQDLRECDRLREDTKEKADDIMNKAASFMGSLPDSD